MGVSWPRMTCSEFLEHLSEFRDRTLTDQRLVRRLGLHMRRCSRCRRRYEALEEGLGALRALGPVSPSGAFRSGLRRRLAAEISLGDPVRPTNAGLTAAFLLAAAVGLFVYQGLARPEADVAVTPEPAAPDRGAERIATPPPAVPETVDVTLPAFAHTSLQFHSHHAPLGSFVTFRP